MTYPARSRQPSKGRLVTTHDEKSAETEVADIEHVKAKGRMICNASFDKARAKSRTD